MAETMKMKRAERKTLISENVQIRQIRSIYSFLNIKYQENPWEIPGGEVTTYSPVTSQERHEIFYLLSYWFNSTTTVLLQGWIWHWITHEEWYVFKEEILNSNTSVPLQG